MKDLCSIGMCLLSFAFTLHAEEKNLIKNADFSDRKEGLPTFWTSNALDTIKMHEEEGRHFVTLAIKRGSEVSSISQSIDRKFQKQQKFKIECEFRPKNDGAMLKVTLRSGSREIVGQNIFHSENLEQWVHQSIELTLASAVNDLEVRISSNVEVDVSKIRLVEIDSRAGDLVLFSLLRPNLSAESETAKWLGLQTATGMIDLSTKEASLDSTKCRSAYDSESVFFILEMREHSLSASDAVELWLGPNGKQESLFQFIIGRTGEIRSYVRASATAQPVELPIEAYVVPSDDSWTAKVRIPFEVLHASYPRDNVRWAFNVSRERVDKNGKIHLSSWAALSDFGETDRFGELAFYSRAEVDADISYWENNDSDPLLRRTSVSGIEISSKIRSLKRAASLWIYDPFSVDRTESQAWNCMGLTDSATARRRGVSPNAETDFPEFFDFADGINRAMLSLSALHLKIEQTERAAFYISKIVGTSGYQPQDTLREIYLSRDELDDEINHAYSIYNSAFHSKWNKDTLLKGNISALSAKIEKIDSSVTKVLEELQSIAGQEMPWIPRRTTLEYDDERRNSNGAPERFWFTAYRLFGDEPAARYFGPFRSWAIEEPYVIADRDNEGKFSLPYANIALERLAKTGQKINFQTGFGLMSYQGPTSSWLERKITNEPNLLARTQDNLPIPYQRIGSLNAFMRRGVNISHPEMMQYTKDYLHFVVKNLLEKRTIDFVLTGWEDSFELRIRDNGKLLSRQRGYDSLSIKAFQENVKARYGNISDVNLRWKTNYNRFSEILPPMDSFLVKNADATGLTYEWQRWQRSSHYGWAKLLRNAVKTAAPEVPVMTDSSHLLLDGTAWESVSQHASDIVSFHSNPTNEDAIFAYLQSVTRDKGLPLASFENYCMMNSRLEGEDERVAAKCMRRYFHDLAARDVRSLALWLGYLNNETSYIAAYGGGVFRLDDDQTILRWPSTEIQLYKRQVSAVELPLVESIPAQGKIAVLIPDSTFLQNKYLNASKDGYSMASYVKLQNQVFSEISLPVEYLHEDKLESSDSDLDRFDALVVLNAPFMRPEILSKIRRWNDRQGKRLFVEGALGFYDEFGVSLPPEASPLRVSFPKLAMSDERPWMLLSESGNEALLKTVAYGRGTVTHLTHPLDYFLSRPKKLKLLQDAIANATVPEVESSNPDIRVQLRRGRRNEIYILVSNRDVRKMQEFDILMSGVFDDVFDLGIPGWFPIHSEAKDGRTIFRSRLAPGDWTLFQLLNPTER